MTPEIIQARIAVALRQEENRNEEWDNYLRLLTNEWTDGKMKLAPNVVHSAVRQLVATVMYEDPEFFARPMNPKYADRSRGVTAYMNYLWDQMQASEQTELVITDAIVYPFAAWKVGLGRSYMSEMELETLEIAEDDALSEQLRWLVTDFDTPVLSSDRHATHIPSHENFLLSPQVEQSPFKEIIVQYVNQHIDEHGDLLVSVEPTRGADTEGDDPDMPYVYRYCPRHLFTDGNHMLFEQSRYILAKLRLNFDDWMENPAYRHPEGIKPTDITDEARQTFDDEEISRTMTERGMGVIDVWEHYDKVNGEFSAWIEGSLTPVRDIQPMPYRFLKGYPFEFLRFQVVPDRLHGPGTLSYLDHPQRMDMDITHRIGTHVKNAGVKWEVVVAQLENPSSEDWQAQITDPEMDGIVKVQQKGAIEAIPPAQLDRSLFDMRAIINQTVQEAIGLNDPARGTITGATATEVRAAQGATQSVLTGAARKVRKSIVNVMQKCLAITREFGPDYLVIPVWGRQNEWEEFKRDDLVGSWQVNVELPLPGDKQNDLNNAINALHEMRSSPNVRGEGLKRLEGTVLRRLDLEPDLFFESQSVDAEEAVEYEHNMMLKGELPQPKPGEDSTYHLEQHDKFLMDLQRDFMQKSMIFQQMGQQMQQMGQMGQQNPQMMGAGQLLQMELQQLQQQMQVVQQHIQLTEQLMPNTPQGRRRNALLFPSENPGTAESIQQNEIGGT